MIETIWVLEYSKKSKDAGMYPWHICQLVESITKNLQTMDRSLDWRIVGMSTDTDELHKLQERLGEDSDARMLEPLATKG